MNKRKIIISLVLTFLILLGGMWVYQALLNQKKPPAATILQKEALRRVAVQKLKPQTTTNHIAIDGRLVAYQQVNLSANVSGNLLPTTREVKKGMSFQKGDLLFDIDQRKANYNLYALRSSLLNAITLIMPELKLDYPEAFVNWKKYLDDFEVEAPVQPLPTITNEREKFFVAAHNIQNLYYNIKSAEAQLSDYKIYAPFSGVITRADVFPGALVMPGQPLGAMMNAYQYELEAPINEKDLGAIRVGNTVKLQSANSDKTWNGKVVRIGNQIDQSTQSIPVYISVGGNGLKEGMYLKGTVKGTALQNVFPLSKKLIVNQEYIYILKDSIIQLQKIAIKSRDDQSVYVTDLDPEMWIIQDDPRGLSEGQKVIPMN